MSPIRMDKLESGVRVVLAFKEAFNQHDVTGIMQLMSEDCILENSEPAPDGAVYSGREAVTQFWRDFFHELPAIQIEVEEIFGFGERCVMRWRESWGPTAGGEEHVRGVDIFRVRNDSIFELLSYVKG